jgi:hypothetical protein
MIIPNNKPDIIICNNEKDHVAISGVRNVIKKEATKILKCKDLTIEIQHLWNVKTNVIPVIIRATGSISQSFRKYLSNISGKHEIKELLNTAILDTAQILQKVQMKKYKRFNIANSVTCTMNCNYTIAATRYCLETWFVLGI